MKRLTILFIVLCLPLLQAQGQVQNRPTTHIPIYRGTEPLITKETERIRALLEGTHEEAGEDRFERWRQHFPQSRYPWNPEELEGVNVFLPLGEGESINNYAYRFTVAWDKETPPQPLHIVDDRWGGYRLPDDRNIVSPLLLQPRTFRYRPIELEKGNVVRFKFEFVPVKFRPLTRPERHDSLEDWSAYVEFIRNQTAPVPEFLDPLVINTAQMRVLVNGKSDGFSIHFSDDGERWYSVNNRPDHRGRLSMPQNLLPSETLYVRIAMDNTTPRLIESFSFDFEATLETRGFHGIGTTRLGQVVGDRVNLPLVFLDGNGDIVLLMDNPESKPYRAY